VEPHKNIITAALPLMKYYPLGHCSTMKVFVK